MNFYVVFSPSTNINETLVELYKNQNDAYHFATVLLYELINTIYNLIPTDEMNIDKIMDSEIPYNDKYDKLMGYIDILPKSDILTYVPIVKLREIKENYTV